MDKCRGVVDLTVCRIFLSVDGVGDLIDVVADGGQFPQQCSVCVGWPWPQLHTQYQTSEKWVDAQSCGSGLFLQVGKLGIRQPHADVPVSRSRRCHLP